MFPRVTNPSAAPFRRRALDLHVLGLPPAFVLSQDQTLKLKSICMLILDVRTSAHRICCSNKFSLLFVVLQLTKLTRSRPNSEADTRLSLNTKKVPRYQRDMQRMIHRMNQTAHISLQKFNSFKERRDKQLRDAPIALACPASENLWYKFPPRSQPNASPLSSSPSGVPVVHLCAASKRLLSPVTKTRNPFIQEQYLSYVGVRLSMF